MFDNIIKIIRKRNTDFQFCMKCQYFSNNCNDILFKKKYKYIRIKYWLLLLSKINFWKEGKCMITIMLKYGNHINLKMKGYEKCLISDLRNDVGLVQKSNKKENK